MIIIYGKKKKVLSLYEGKWKQIVYSLEIPQLETRNQKGKTNSC